MKGNAVTIKAAIAVAALAMLIASAVSVMSAQATVEPPAWVGIYLTSGKAGLKWEKAPSAARYRLYRGISSGKDYKLIATTTDVSYIDADVKPGETYYYVLKSVDTAGVESAYSDERYIKVQAAVTGSGLPVEPPVWSEAVYDLRHVRLAWMPSASANALAYNIYRSLSETSGFQLVGSTQDTGFTDSDVREGATYYYAVTTLDKEFKETAFSEVRPVVCTPSETAGAEGAARTGKPSGTPEEQLPDKIIAKPTRLVSFITRGKDDLPLFSPTDIDLSPDGYIFVTDTGNSMIQVYKPDGVFERAFGGYGKEAGKFERVLGIDVDKDGFVYAVDAYTGRLQKFDKMGKLQMLKEMLKDAKAIANDLGRDEAITQFGILKALSGPGGDIFVVDNFNQCIIKYSSNGTYITTFGGEGTLDGKFLGPTFATFDADGKLYVSDCFNARIQVFDTDGKFLWKFGSYGNILGTFSRPKGLYIDGATGRIYVSDSMTNAIQVFDPDGKLLFVLGDERGRQIDMGTPNGIVMDEKNRIYVVEKLASRVQIRQIGER